MNETQDRQKDVSRCCRLCMESAADQTKAFMFKRFLQRHPKAYLFHVAYN